MTEAERAKKIRQAMFIMFGADVAAVILFWLARIFMAGNPYIAFAILIVGLGLGAAYYIYQSYKLRS